jgi:hypothetical protein
MRLVFGTQGDRRVRRGRTCFMPSTGPSERELYQRRHMAESFGSDPERYDRSRPRYPDAMVERIVAASHAPTCSTWAVALGSPPDSSRRPAAVCLASSPTRVWPNGRANVGLRSRWRPLRPGTSQTALSMWSLQDRAGTGWSRSQAQPRLPRYCGPPVARVSQRSPAAG